MLGVPAIDIFAEIDDSGRRRAFRCTLFSRASKKRSSTAITHAVSDNELL